jgi:hypothetical protein
MPISKEDALKVRALIESMTKPTQPTCPNNPKEKELNAILKQIYDILSINKIEPKQVEYKLIDMHDKKLDDILKGDTNAM